jgi:DNA-binding transcriptional MocR family regulator
MIDLKLNYPSIKKENLVIKSYFESINYDFEENLKFPKYEGAERDLYIVSKWLNISEETAKTISTVIQCSSANHSLSCIIQTLKKKHKSIITEPFTYPAFKSIALANDFQLFASEFDSQGLTVKGLNETIERTGSKIIYLQPTIQNPTCAVMSIERRIEIAKLAKKKNILIIEDDAYRFLHPNPPLRFLDIIPENTFHIFSLSKPFNPLIKTSFVIAPKLFSTEIIEKVRLSSSGSSTLLSGIASYILNEKILDEIIIEKQILAKSIQSKLLPNFKNINFTTFESSFHIWIELPEYIKSSNLVKTLLDKEIVISDGNEFLVENQSKRDKFIRISIGGEKITEKLQNAIMKVIELIEQNAK